MPAQFLQSAAQLYCLCQVFRIAILKNNTAFFNGTGAVNICPQGCAVIATLNYDNKFPGSAKGFGKFLLVFRTKFRHDFIKTGLTADVFCPVLGAAAEHNRAHIKFLQALQRRGKIGIDFLPNRYNTLQVSAAG